ncbi:hypothetical protein K3495_g12708 [Podosphaera aphanis]|nr:hypothetical protein K3495_g12708 [Podosphaera aphanis]
MAYSSSFASFTIQLSSGTSRPRVSLIIRDRTGDDEIVPVAEIAHDKETSLLGQLTIEVSRNNRDPFLGDENCANEIVLSSVEGDHDSVGIILPE